MNVICWQCSTPFEAPKEQVKRWAESGAPFDPTEWECGCTEAAQHGVQPNDAAAQNSDSGSVCRVIG